MSAADVLVLGQIARDLVLLVDQPPGPHASAPVRERREMLGGKGANQAVSLAQLGAVVALLGVVGDDADGDGLLAQAARDGIAVGGVVRRPQCRSALIVDIVDRDHRWHYLEDIPDATLLTESDVRAAQAQLSAAHAVIAQLQQPAPAIRAAAGIARAAGALVVLDGAPPPEAADELLAQAHVLRADDQEARLLTGRDLDDRDDTLDAARELLSRSPALRLVALGAGQHGNVFAWRDGSLTVPLADVPVADTTGGGDALVAALTLSLVRGAEPQQAAEAAVAAAAHTVQHMGGRPSLTPELLNEARASRRA